MATTNETGANSPLLPIVRGANLVGEAALPRLPSGPVDVASWTRQLGVAPIENLDELIGGVWPDEEPVDDFHSARQQWRSEGLGRSESQSGPSA